MNALLNKTALYSWGALQLLRLGRPEVSLGFLGGIGDDLLCTAAIHEWLNRGARRIWFFTRHPELYSHFDDRVRLVKEDPRLRQLTARIGRPMHPLSYSVYDPATDRDTPPSRHIIADMCARAGLTGKIALRPYLAIAPDEPVAEAPWGEAIVVQSSGLVASVPMRTKQWRTEAMQEVVNHFTLSRPVIQIGAPADPLLRGAIDLRGKTNLRATAVGLSRARLFVGTVGFPMHLARAVECPAVIVYGGRETPELTGYSCNINLVNQPACSPCWQRNRCDFNYTCTASLTPAQVIAGVELALSRPRGPLGTDSWALN